MIIPISGCLFHFGQCIWHEVQPCGLQKKYNEDKFFLLSVKTLTAIAFLPIDDIVNTFELLEKEFHDDTNDLLQYFEKTWIGERSIGYKKPRFNNELWNMYDRIVSDLPRTNNTVEGWNNVSAN
ncbi:unnamed protein product [Adineta steineri]|uniref:MULE domain-containing protein n=1 Tax=Adineta steineri TaxID=433720 RepID=A0A818FQV9_9BILA|nr:unnamed protein product [Adineta steineri]